MHEYKTIAKPGFFEETEKRSRFISFAFCVENEEQIQEYLKKARSDYYNAKHCVYAYRLQKNNVQKNNVQKFSDDGEPGGAAGLPILNAIISHELNNVLVIVVRYFGGILLGTPGLRKMYSSGANGAIENATVKTMCRCSYVRLEADYKEYGKFLNLINQYRSKVLNIKYEDTVNIDFYIDNDDFSEFCKESSNISKGKKVFEVISESYVSL